MKTINLELLKKIHACKSGINKFKNTSELHGIDLTNIKEITVSDKSLFDDIRWLVNKKIIKVNKLTYKDSDGYSYEYTYDSDGNVLTYKDSNGYSYEYTYDEKYDLDLFKIVRH